MSVELTIERLVLDGVPAELARRPELKTALIAELTRLIAAGGPATLLPAGGGDRRDVRAAEMQQPATGSPSAWGVAIARAVYGGATG
jgi:hypothetical protein